MPFYGLEIEHRETDQIFSYYHGEVMLHFNASLLGRMRDRMEKEFRRITMDLDVGVYDLCMKHRGIEEPKVERIRPIDLRAPGLGVLFEDGSFTIVDGHHRLVRRWRGGVRVMDFWVCPPATWEHCLVHYPPELEKFLAMGMPERVLDPALIPSVVKVHKP